MILGRIVGSVVSTIHHPVVEGRTLLAGEVDVDEGVVGFFADLDDDVVVGFLRNRLR